ncbi:HK97 family phage prohead protease [Glutamicibacter ardleyensis]|uniref:Prohead protease n=1 Tax=Glutamicibacter ardleyensis TaxID=225894 RepID=A0ABQ2DX63_9MICC|nr:HK97 family phage prohead protease [Glutamicibacter ardleyensis]GGJ74421.1 prohead protease [Glutamicibacter ardleyensis]
MKVKEIERRFHTSTIELRASTNGIGVLFGYAAVFNRYSQNLGGFVEQVDPAAFNKSLADGAEVLARFNHSDGALLGTSVAETVRLGVDGTGLWYEIDLPDTTHGRDVKALAERGDLRFSSFAFRTMEDDWGYTNEDFPLRTLKAVQLVDVAPVVSPAYRDTSTGLRSLADRFDLDLDETRKAAEQNKLATLLHDKESSRAHGHEERLVEGQRETHPSISELRAKVDAGVRRAESGELRLKTVGR